MVTKHLVTKPNGYKAPSYKAQWLQITSEPNYKGSVGPLGDFHTLFDIHIAEVSDFTL